MYVFFLRLCGILNKVSKAMFLWAAVSVALNAMEGEREAKETRLPWFYGFAFLMAGLLSSMPLYADYGIFDVQLLFGGIGLLIIWQAAVYANQRIMWDDTGFEYRTAMRRTIRYRYEDIVTMKTIVGLVTPSPETLFVHVGYRRLIIDGFALWTGFAGAYEKWQFQNGQLSWREAQRIRHAGRSRSRIGRKLDRIPAGRVRAVCFTLIGIVFSVFGFMAFSKKGVVNAYGGLVCMVFGIYGFSYWYAVMHLDDKPHLIRRYIVGNCQIRPDPDKKTKDIRH